MSFCPQVILSGFDCWGAIGSLSDGSPSTHTPPHISPVLLLKEALACRLLVLTSLLWLEVGHLGADSQGPFGISMGYLLTARGLPPWCWWLVPGSWDSGPRSEKRLLPQFLRSEHYPKDRGMASLLQVPSAHPLKLWVSEQGSVVLSTPSHALSARGTGPNRHACAGAFSILVPVDSNPLHLFHSRYWKGEKN